MSSEYAIEVEGLSKCFSIYKKPYHKLLEVVTKKENKHKKIFWAVRDVDLKIRRGETVGIIGKNGSGKSTLLQMICGTMNQTSGKIKTNGKIAALLELGAGFNPEFSGIENIYMSAALYGLDRKEISNRLPGILDFADIGDHIYQPVKTYSSGMYVRVAFAVITHVDADILVIDEALAVGDVFFTQKCMRFIREFAVKNTILFVSHDTSSVINLCNRAVWLDQGNLMMTGETNVVCEKYLENLFGKTVLDVNPPKLEKKQGLQRIGVDKEYETVINNRIKRNKEYEIFKFSEVGNREYGGNNGRIINVVFTDKDGSDITAVKGGELVTLKINAVSNYEISSPIIGFFVKDKLGQMLFGDNTYSINDRGSLKVNKNGLITAKFKFYMPWLVAGNYVIQVAFANGTQEEHEQLHWIHEALHFVSHHKMVSTGIIGIPMIEIELEGDNNA